MNVTFTNISKKIISIENIKLSIDAFTEFANSIAIKNIIENPLRYTLLYIKKFICRKKIFKLTL